MHIAGVTAVISGCVAGLGVLDACTCCPISARGTVSDRVEKYGYPWGLPSCLL